MEGRTLTNDEFKELAKKFNKIAQAFAKRECDKGEYFYKDAEGNDLENCEILRGLTYYFAGDGINAARYDIDIRKSIRLVGNTGGGKTMIMRIFAEMFKSFKIQRALDLVEDYDDNGNSVLKTYGRNAIYVDSQKQTVVLRNLMIDDIGKEDQGRYFKTEKNVIAHLIDCRYDHWLSYGLKTHFTDNLNDDELYKRYGDRIFGRVMQMTNRIVLGGSKSSIDWRL